MKWKWTDPAGKMSIRYSLSQQPLLEFLADTLKKQKEARHG
jgi:hypothetical protein